MRASDAGVPDAEWPYVPAPNAARFAATRASVPGCASATLRPSIAWRRARSSSADANRGRIVTSATSASAAASCGRVTVIATNARSQPAPRLELPTQRFGGLRDLRRRSRRRALREQRRREVGQAGQRRRVRFRAGTHDEFGGDERHVAPRRDDDAQPVGERAHFGHRDRPARAARLPAAACRTAARRPHARPARCRQRCRTTARGMTARTNDHGHHAYSRCSCADLGKSFITRRRRRDARPQRFAQRVPAPTRHSSSPRRLALECASRGRGPRSWSPPFVQAFNPG